MTKETVTATVQDSDREVAVEYDFGDNLSDMVALFGEEVVYSRAKSACVIDLQGLVRRHIKGVNEDGSPKFTDEAIQAVVDSWKPGIKSVSRKSKSEKIVALFDGLSEEDKAALLEQLATSE